MKKINENINTLIKAIYAGIMIGIGGIVYLMSKNSIIGATLFGIGLFTICVYKMNLYTGMVGYILENKINYVFKLLITLIGNFIGTFLTAVLIINTRLSDIIIKAKNISLIKINDSYLSILILSFFCGILMYLAVNNYKKSENVIKKYLSIFLSVIVFILCGFEHCIANMFYFSVAEVWSLKSIFSVIIMIIGNSLGAIFISIYDNKIK